MKVKMFLIEVHNVTIYDILSHFIISLHKGKQSYHNPQ
jgi:hypothetical protein